MDAKNAKSFSMVQLEPFESIHDIPQPKNHARSTLRTIVLSVILPCTPVLLISGLLLWMVYSHKLPPQIYPALTQDSPNQASQNISAWLKELTYKGPTVLTNYPGTTITTVSAWTSKIIPYLTGSIMALVAVFAARHIIQASKMGDDAALLSPVQLTLIIDLLGGDSFQPILNTVMLRAQHAEKLLSPIPAVFWCLFSLTTMGIVIPIVDTWFGTTTESVAYQSMTTMDMSAGFELNTTVCPNGTFKNLGNDILWPCNLFPSDYRKVGVTGGIGVLQGQRADQASINIPNLENKLGVKIQQHPPQPRDSNDEESDWLPELGDSAFFYYAPLIASQDFNGAFQADTFASRTQCEMITTDCVNSSSTGDFSCSTGFSGDINAGEFPSPLYPPPANCENCAGYASDVRNLGIMFSKDANLTFKPAQINTTLESGSYQYPEFLVQNPTYFGFWAVDYPDSDILATIPQDALTHESILNVTIGGSNHSVWFMNCNTTIYSVNLVWYNYTIKTWDAKLLDPDMAALFTVPFNLFADSSILNAAMVELATTASFQATLNPEVMAIEFSNIFSRTALAQAVGTMQPRKSQFGLVVDYALIATRIRLVPFYILIGLKMVFVMTVIGLAVAAFSLAQPSEMRSILEKLTTKGLAGAYFDDPRLLQKNAVGAMQSFVDETAVKTQAQIGVDEIHDLGEKSESRPLASVDEAHPAPVKVGFVPDADGIWKYAVRVNGVWQFIGPLVKAVTP